MQYWRFATVDDIVRRLTSTPYATTAATEDALGPGMGDAQLGIIDALNRAILAGLVTVVEVRDTSYGKGIRFVALAAPTPVTLAEYDANPAHGCAEYAAHDAATDAYIGEVWHTDGTGWHAYRRGTGTGAGMSAAGATRAEVLARVGWSEPNNC